MALPTLNSHHLTAAHQTFVKPITDSLKWRVGQLAPKQIAYNLLASNGIGQAALDYKFNLDFAKNPFMGGFTNTAALGSPGSFPTTNIPETGGDTGGVIRVISETFNAGFSKMVNELKAIRMTVMQLGRVATISNETEVKHTSKLSELVEIMKGVFQRNKFNDAESNLERGNAAEANVTSGKNGEAGRAAMAQVMGNIFSKIGEFLMSKATWVGGLAILFRNKIFDATKFVFTKLADGIKGIRIGEGIKKLIEPIGRSFNRIIEFVTDIGKHLSPVVKILSKSKSLAKTIPIVGQFIALAMAVFDGVTGFMEEFKEEDGSIIAKIRAGFGGAVKGIIKGILEIPKAIILGVKWLAEQAMSILGFKEQAEKLKNFKFGEKFDEFVDGIFVSIMKVFKPSANLIDNLGEFVVRAFKALVIKFIPGAESVLNMLGINTDVSTPDYANKVPGGTNQPTMVDNAVTAAKAAVERTREFVDNAVHGTQKVLGDIGDNLAKGLEIPMEYYKSIRSAESSGKDNAKNPNSSASGRYQFTKGTWRGLGYDWDDRFNPELQEQAIRRLTNSNAEALRRHNIAINGGSLYAAHFLGAGGGREPGAIDVYKHNDDSTPMAAILPEKVLIANPNLRKMNVGEFKKWAFQKGGGALTPPNAVANPKAGSQATQMEHDVIAQAKRDARRSTPPTVQNNVSAPTVVNNNVQSSRTPKPQTQAERYRQWVHDNGPRP